MRSINLTKGNITVSLVRFTLPMIGGALMQQCYNIVDTLIVGRFIGADALAAVGSAYALMVFVTSIIIGLTMGSGALLAIQYGGERVDAMKRSIAASVVLCGAVTIVLWIVVLAGLHPILRFMQVPQEIYGMMYGYLKIVSYGIVFTLIYNLFAAILRSVGNSLTPLWFLALSVVANVVLDVVFVLYCGWGIEGAAIATVVAQGIAAVWLWLFVAVRYPELRLRRNDWRMSGRDFNEIASFSLLTCVQQSVMNFGILMVQGLVNSFGPAVMAAFAVAVKIDSFAYMPVQEFGNAFSTFVAQNFGAGEIGRVRVGMCKGFMLTVTFSVIVSLVVCIFSRELMMLFLNDDADGIVEEGIRYLSIEGPFYFGIGMLFLWYGYYRAVKLPSMSVVLTVVSLGLRVSLAYMLASIPGVGVVGIWWSIPIGWLIADGVALGYYRLRGCQYELRYSCD